jgi:antitoxin HicB
VSRNSIERPEPVDTVDYEVILTRDDAAKWTAEVPALPGCITWGSSRDEALALVREAIEGWLLSRRATGKSIPSPTVVVELARVSVG